MRKGTAVLVSLMIMSVIIAAPAFADRTTEDLQSRVLERFDAPSAGADANKGYDYAQNHRWIVRGSKFITAGYPKFSWVKTWPAALFPTAPEGSDLHSLGVQAAFDRQGYNYLEFIPVEDADKDGKPVETAIPLIGRAKNIDLWAWGSNYNYYLELQLRDYRGMIHVLRVGDLNYKGWRNLKVEIPPYIPQDVTYVPNRKGLELVKIVLWTRPEEKVNGFYFYLKQIKIMTDTYESPFDGSNLGDAAAVDKLWSADTSAKK